MNVNSKNLTHEINDKTLQFFAPVSGGHFERFFQFSPNPRATGTKVAGVGGTIPFKATFEGLPTEITYYMQAYAKTEHCTAYGNEIVYCGKQVLNPGKGKIIRWEQL